MLATIPLIALIGIVYFGAFSRFTSGQYTPGFYAYQLDRAPNEGYARIIPFADTVLATLLLFGITRPWAALLCVIGQGGGLLARLQEGKPVVPDVALFLTALVVFVTSRGRRR